MNNCLILITNYYPFYKGEEYLESEIKYLSEKFEKIYVISTMVSKTMKQTREVPQNVILITTELEHSKLGKIKMVKNNYKLLTKDRKKIIKEDINNNILKSMYCNYFECRAMEVYKKIKIKLDKSNLKKSNGLVIYSYWMYITAKIGIELKKNYFQNDNIKMITRAHRYDLYEDDAPLKYLPQRKFLLENIDYIYPCSQNGVDFLKTKYPMAKKKIEVKRLGTIGNGLGVNINNKKLSIVSCSAIRKVKRIELIIYALKNLEERNIDYEWIHIGDGAGLSQIKKLASKNLNKKNYVFKGFMKNSEIMEYYKNNSISAFINVSESEGVPVSIMEAMSKGIPIIATNVGGTNEIVKDGINGFLLEKNCSASEISEKIITLKNLSETKYKEICKKSFEIWNEKSNAEKLYLDFANELAKNICVSEVKYARDKYSCTNI